MKKKIKYTEGPMGELRIIKDFLPPPYDLSLKEEKIMVTIPMNKSSIEFFKKRAKEQHTSYQLMIQRLIDLYASYYKKSA